ncbi:signal recognition particle-docking protein FtsY [Segnochrobactraceae bacterium EtOH-i3]
MSRDDGDKRGFFGKIFLAKPPRHEHPPEVIEPLRPKKPVPAPEPAKAEPVAPPEPAPAPVAPVVEAAPEAIAPAPVAVPEAVAERMPAPAVEAVPQAAEPVALPEPEPEPVAALPEAPAPVVEPVAVVEPAEPVAPEVAPEISPEPEVPVAEAVAEEGTPEPESEVHAAEPVPEPEPQAAPEPVAEVAPVVPVVPAAVPEPVFAPTVVETVAPAEEPVGFLTRLKRGLSRTSGALAGGITALFTKRKLDAATLQDLEDLLIQADLGVETATAIADRLSKGRHDRQVSDEEVRTVLAEEIEAVLKPVAKPLVIDPKLKPHVVLVVGVNGTGKTTTIGKLAARLTRTGKSVTMVAGDTFRAAAIEQLKVWGTRAGAKVISKGQGADAAGLVFDAFAEAKAEGTDVLLVDTAGRLQNRAELMAELEKVIRVIRKQDPTAPHDVLLVLDATTGQNAMTQVEVFGRSAGVTGLVMTKLDGTARGGILVAISARHAIPVHLIGVGETVEDLAPFDPKAFGRAIAGLE